jgi:hypothetical protein
MTKGAGDAVASEAANERSGDAELIRAAYLEQFPQADVRQFNYARTSTG